VEGVTAHGAISEGARESVMRELRAAFRLEFLNRVDEIVLFKPLTLPEIEKIVDLQVEDLRRRLKDRDIRLELTEEARAFTARAGFDPVYGARPMKRYLQRELETRIGRAIIAGEIPDGSTVTVSVKKGELAVAVAPASVA
jgi:ATP-dependent Clp protease ATP-binding subunit ClpB